MAKAGWGTKRICQNCSARFYDLKRSPPVCPVCGTVQAPETTTRSSGAKAARKPAAAPAPAPADEEVELEGIEDEVADDEIIEDASELGEDDMSEVLTVEDEVEKEP
ncbi:MAG: TIGR02300 family protein [Alphaproteobacteria bacterium]